MGAITGAQIAHAAGQLAWKHRDKIAHYGGKAIRWERQNNLKRKQEAEHKYPMKHARGGHRDVVRNGSANHPDKALDSTHPVEETYYRHKESKAGKKKRRRIKKFVKKVQHALEIPQKHSIWCENTIVERAIAFQGANNQVDWQDATSSGLISELMLHPGSLNLNVNGFVTYPYQALKLMSADANLIATGGVGATAVLGNPIDSVKLKTTVSRMQINLKNVHATATVFVDIYTFIAAQDIINQAYATPIKAWQQVANNNAITATPANQEAAYVTANYTSAVSVNVKGTTPLDHPIYGEYWKQETKTTLEIGAGLRMTWAFPKARKGHFDTQMSFGKYAIKGHTQAAIMVFRVNHGEVLNNVAIINYEVNKQYHYKVLGSDKTPIGNLTSSATYIAA